MLIDIKKFKFVGYSRKSSESEDRQVQSIDDQNKFINKMTREKKLNLFKIFSESKTAKIADNRPQYSEMIDMIKNGKANAIICWNINRLVRNLKEGGELQYLLSQGVIQAIITNEGDFYQEDSPLLFSVLVGEATHYSWNLSRNVKRGMQSKREKGQYPHKAPMGYINKNKKIVPDPKRFNLVKMLFDKILNDKSSIEEIKNFADDELGFTTRKTKRIGGKQISKSRLYEMFSNPFYIGEYTINGKTYKLKHQKMITEEQFDIIQVILGRKNKSRRKSHEFAYRGPIFCGECGCMVTAEEKTKKIKSTGKSISYTYYHCTGRRGNCSQTEYIREDKLKELIKNEVSRFTIMPQFRDWALEVLRESHKDEVNERKKIFNNLEKLYKETENKINNLIDMRASDEITKDEFDRKKEEYTVEKARIKEKIDNYDHRVSQWFEMAEQAFDFISVARDAFENGNLNTKRAILTAIGKNITLLDGKIIIEPEEWLVPIADKYPALQKQYQMFEPAKNTNFTHKNEILAPIRTAWLGKKDSNLR
ncbi:MAG: recombinase family protein [Actinobacteria bacterium]|nr:recombinase family protein [Actinomycetota bacterium]